MDRETLLKTPFLGFKKKVLSLILSNDLQTTCLDHNIAQSPTQLIPLNLPVLFTFSSHRDSAGQTPVSESLKGSLKAKLVSELIYCSKLKISYFVAQIAR